MSSSATVKAVLETARSLVQVIAELRAALMQKEAELVKSQADLAGCKQIIELMARHVPSSTGGALPPTGLNTSASSRSAPSLPTLPASLPPAAPSSAPLSKDGTDQHIGQAGGSRPRLPPARPVYQIPSSEPDLPPLPQPRPSTGPIIVSSPLRAAPVKVTSKPPIKSKGRKKRKALRQTSLSALFGKANVRDSDEEEEEEEMEVKERPKKKART